MQKVYIYKDVEYQSEYLLRKAIFKEERLALPKISTAEDWAKHGVVYTEVEVQLTQEQLEQQVRLVRDRLLSDCDYYVMPDYPSAEEGLAEVKAYRQALRDITKQEGFPTEVVWPEKPEILA